MQPRLKVNIYTVLLVARPGTKSAPSTLPTVAHNVLAVRRQHQATPSALLRADGNAARQGQCRPFSLEGHAGYVEVLRLPVRPSSQLCPAVHQCLP